MNQIQLTDDETYKIINLNDNFNYKGKTYRAISDLENNSFAAKLTSRGSKLLGDGIKFVVKPKK